ncbi:hypothetical protein Trydic_g12221 [Trypoxylus dichotomus]
MDRMHGGSKVTIWTCFSYYGTGPMYRVERKMHAPIYVTDWPAQSSDLNPIENLWVNVKQAIFEAKSSNFQEPWHTVGSAWTNIPIECCQRLVDSMPGWCAAGVTNRDYATKY